MSKYYKDPRTCGHPTNKLEKHSDGFKCLRCGWIIKQKDTMKEVAKDLIYMEINDDDTIASLKEKFINIIKKHNIKYGMIDKSGNVHVANFEWTMCQVLFLDTIIVKLKMDMMLMDLPKELEY